jgi:hypothetical protein
LAKMGTEGVEKVTVLLNTYFGGLIKLIHDYGGDIVKFAGDALMAIWPHSYRYTLSHSISSLSFNIFCYFIPHFTLFVFFFQFSHTISYQ